MHREKVESSNVASVGYDPRTKTLEVEFHTGVVYTYADVPGQEYAGFIAAESKGLYLRHKIIGNFMAKKMT